MARIAATRYSWRYGDGRTMPLHGWNQIDENPLAKRLFTKGKVTTRVRGIADLWPKNGLYSPEEMLLRWKKTFLESRPDRSCQSSKWSLPKTRLDNSLFSQQLARKSKFLFSNLLFILISLASMLIATSSWANFQAAFLTNLKWPSRAGQWGEMIYDLDGYSCYFLSSFSS